jgi:chromosome segregation ATPase
MSVTEADITDLKARVTRLERASVNNTETITWMASTLGTVKAGVDMHTKRLDSIDHRLDGIDSRLDGLDKRMDRFESQMDRLEVGQGLLKATFDELREEMPAIVAAALRDVMRKP